MAKKRRKDKPSLFGRILGGIERAGNRLPHPITLFALFTLGIILVSALCALLGVSATGELINSKTLELETQTVTAVSLLSKEGVVYMLTSMVSNFTSFAPLGVVLVTMLGAAAGLAAAFAGVSGGFSANQLIGALDPLLAGISTEAAHIVDSGYTVLATDNWFFMIASTVLIVAIGTLVTDKIVEPRLGRFEQEEGQADHRLTALTGQEAKGMKIASLVLLLLVAGLIAAAIPRASLLRNPQTGSLTTGAPLIDGIIILLALLFFVPSVLYGRISGTYKNEKDVAGQLEKNMAAMGGYIALIFVAAQFISFFNYSKLGTILAISGAEFLTSSGISGPLLMVIFVLFTSLLNLLMGSATAKWTVLAPIFIPMFMMLGYSPELTQVAYRIGDSCTNLITPMMSYFAMIVVFARKYDKKAGIGTLVSMMLPYSLFFLIGWTVLLVVWMITGLPLGPGAATLLG